MRRLFWRASAWRFRGAPYAAAAVLLALAACSDDGVSPTARAFPGASALSAPSGGAALVPNGQKYRDSSAPHATGRSGSAMLSGRAVLGAADSVRLTITSSGIRAPGVPLGDIVKAQVKAFAPDGTQLFTVNFHRLLGHTQTFVFAGLPAGAELRVQANVRGIDPRRTDVVTLSAQVQRAPSLTVDFQAPERVLPDVPVPITAVVTETGGDLGARADCVLYVNGVEVERITGIWVDAGDAVTCAFTTTFPEGDNTVQVTLESSDRDAVLAPDPAPQDVEAVFPRATTYTASALDRTLETTRVLEYQWSKPDGSHKEYRNLESNRERTQTLSVSGTLNRAAAFPLQSVRVRMGSAGRTHEDEAWADLAGLPDGAGRDCVSRYIAGQSALFTFCSQPGGSAFSYTRFAGTVTYHSHGFSNTWDNVAGAWTQFYSWNDTWETYRQGAQIKEWGSAVSVSIEVTDGAGSFSIDPWISLASFDVETGTTARTCRTDTFYWLEGGSQETCEYGSTREYGVRGTTSG
jgi:hypothetical protein